MKNKTREEYYKQDIKTRPLPTAPTSETTNEVVDRIKALNKRKVQ